MDESAIFCRDIRGLTAHQVALKMWTEHEKALQFATVPEGVYKDLLRSLSDSRKKREQLVHDVIARHTASIQDWGRLSEKERDEILALPAPSENEQ